MMLCITWQSLVGSPHHTAFVTFHDFAEFQNITLKLGYGNQKFRSPAN